MPCLERERERESLSFIQHKKIFIPCKPVVDSSYLGLGSRPIRNHLPHFLHFRPTHFHATQYQFFIIAHMSWLKSNLTRCQWRRIQLGPNCKYRKSVAYIMSIDRREIHLKKFIILLILQKNEFCVIFISLVSELFFSNHT